MTKAKPVKKSSMGIAKSIIHLIDFDIGRPLADMKINLEHDNLTDDCRLVLATLK